MSTDRQALTEQRRAKRQGLRVAIAVTVGFCMGLAQADPLPFLAPLFASQLLLTSRRPPTLRQGLVTMLVVILSAALLVFITGLFRERPWVLLPLLWLFHLCCFAAQGRRLAGALPSLMLIIAIAVPMLDIVQPDLGDSIALLLSRAISLGILLAWAAHALLPDIGGTYADEPHGPEPARAQAIHQAAASATILLALLALCLSDQRLATAMVIPITVASLLGQLELDMSRRTALGLLVVNVLGGVAASLAFTLFELRPTLWWVILIVALVSLLFAGEAALGGAKGKAFAGALMVFLILFGLGVSPLPTATPELFSTRIAYVLFAVGYALFSAALLWPRRPDWIR